MKKLIVLISLLLFLPIFFINNRLNNSVVKVNAIGSCPSGVSTMQPDWDVVKPSGEAPPLGAGPIIGVYDNQYTRFSSVLISFGDGNVRTLPPDAYGRAYITHAYTQVGDFPLYALLKEFGSAPGWDYVCYFSSPIPVYNVYEGFSASLADPGTNSVTFDSNTLPGGDNIIGAVDVGFHVDSGNGGVAGTPVNMGLGLSLDAVEFTVKNSQLNWLVNEEVWLGDFDVTDGSTTMPQYPDSYSILGAGMAIPNLSQRTNEVTFMITRPQNAYTNYGSPGQQITTNTNVNASITSNPQKIYWRPRVVSQPPTPTIPNGDGGTPTPTTPESPSDYWSFPAQVLNPNLTPVPGVNVKLSYSDNIPDANPQPQADVSGVACSSSLAGGTYWNYYSHSKCTPPNLTDCAQDTGYCYLGTPSQSSSYNHNFYFVRVNDPNYTAVNTYCRWGDNSFGSSYTVPPYTARPSTASSCYAVTLDSGEKAVLRGTTPFGYSVAARGSYAGNVLIVVTSTPTPTLLPPTPTNTPTPPPQNPWFQAAGGNAYSKGTISTNLPSGEIFNIDISNLASEGVSYSTSIIVGSGTAGKNAGSTAFPELLTYTELKNRFDTIIPLSGSSLQKSAISPAGSLGNTQVFEVSDTTLTGDWTNFSGNAVIFIDGDLTINENVTVTSGSFLGFVASGDITVDPSVDTVEGFYFTNGDFVTGSSATALTLNGTFVANDFNLDRNLGASNLTTPAEVFSYRPDFAFTAPLELRRPYRHFQEVAP